jgi:hypothetical protein
MSLLRSVSDGLRSLFRKEQVSQELDEELNGFLEMAAEEKMKQGMSRKDALRAVRLERGESRSYEGSRPFCRLGIFSGDVLARFALRRSNAAQEPWLHCCWRPQPWRSVLARAQSSSASFTPFFLHPCLIAIPRASLSFSTGKHVRPGYRS